MKKKNTQTAATTSLNSALATKKSTNINHSLANQATVQFI